MANHAPVILVAGNHGAELEGDLYVFGRAKGKRFCAGIWPKSHFRPLSEW
jgi:hypothetical protein